MSVCEVCGSEVDETNLRRGCIYCTERKGFVCFECSTACESRAKQMLPNGTQCYKKWEAQPMEKRLLGRRWLASPERIEAETERYIDIPPDELQSKYEEAVNYYDTFTANMARQNIKISAERLITMRARIAAMQQLLFKYQKQAEQAAFHNKIASRSVVKHYRKTYGTPPNPRIMEQISEFLKLGVSANLICQAIDSAADKDKRWNYVKGIIENCINENKASLDEPKACESTSIDIEAFETMLAGNY